MSSQRGIYHRYVHKEHAKIFVMVLFAMSLLFVAANFLDVVDDALERHVSVLYALAVSTLRLPRALKELGGISILISVLLFMVIASRNLETVVLRALGVELGKLKKVFLIQASVLSVLLLINSLFIAPRALLMANDLYHGAIKGEKRYKRVSPVKMWLKHSGFICYLGFFDEKRANIRDLRCYNRKEKKIVVSPLVVWRKGWVAKGMKEWIFKGNTSSFRRFRARAIDFLPPPEDIASRKKRIAEMDGLELISILSSLSAEGIDNTPYARELANRIFVSLFPLAMVLLAFPLGVTEPRRAQVSLAFVKGILMALAAYGAYYSAGALGGSGILHTFLTSAIPFGLVLWLGRRFSERVDRC